MTMNNLFYHNNYLGKPIQFLLEKLEIRRWLYNIDKNRKDTAQKAAKGMAMF